LNNPKLIIVDEPTAGLDPAERNRFLNVFREVSSNNIVIFSTHLVDDVKELCTNMAIMNKGHILLKASPTEAIASIAGKVWSVDIAKSDLNELESTYHVLSSNYNEDDSLAIRVYAENQPNPSFTSVTPNLEDVYFITLGNDQ